LDLRPHEKLTKHRNYNDKIMSIETRKNFFIFFLFCFTVSCTGAHKEHRMTNGEAGLTFKLSMLSVLPEGGGCGVLTVAHMLDSLGCPLKGPDVPPKVKPPSKDWNPDYIGRIWRDMPVNQAGGNATEDLLDVLKGAGAECSSVSSCEEVQAAGARGESCMMGLSNSSTGHLLPITNTSPDDGNVCNVTVKDTGQQGDGGVGAPLDPGEQVWHIGPDGKAGVDSSAPDSDFWNGLNFGSPTFTCCKPCPPHSSSSSSSSSDSSSSSSDSSSSSSDSSSSSSDSSSSSSDSTSSSSDSTSSSSDSTSSSSDSTSSSSDSTSSSSDSTSSA
jgi:hypothetical protein